MILLTGGFYCQRCGGDWGEDLGPVCTRCGGTEKVDKLATKGRIVGEALAAAISPGDVLSKTLMGTLGSFVGRRMTRDYPLISIGEVDLRPRKLKIPKPPKAPKAPKKALMKFKKSE